MDNTFDFHASHANISPRTWCQKSSPLFVAFVSATLNLDLKTYHYVRGTSTSRCDWKLRAYMHRMQDRPRHLRGRTPWRDAPLAYTKFSTYVYTHKPYSCMYTSSTAVLNLVVLECSTAPEYLGTGTAVLEYSTKFSTSTKFKYASKYS